MQPDTRDATDPIMEAQARHHYTTREAYGTVDGDRVYLVARLSEYRQPLLEAMVGGRWEHYEDDAVEDEYVGHTRVRRRFESIEDLEAAFDRLVDAYSLQDDLPDAWTEAPSA